MSILSALRPRNASERDREEGVAILMVLAYIGIFTSLMLAMLAIVIGQVRPTAQARKDVGSINAASSGLQVALTAMRTATDTKADGSAGAGNRGRLPCKPVSPAGTGTRFIESGVTKNTDGARVRGVASDLPGNFEFEYNVAYYLQDPTDKDLAWLQANSMTCPADRLVKTPLFAYIQSYGVGDAVVGGTEGRGNRSQSAVYRFSVPTENVAGGRIRMRDKQTLCWDAGVAPDVGSQLKLQNCADPAVPQQRFAYRTDLTLFYGGNPSLNLCITGSNSQVPSLQRCTGVGTGDTGTKTGSSYSYLPGQQSQIWNYSNDGAFSAAADNGTADDKKCVGPNNLNAGEDLRWGGFCGKSLDPDPAVGAGKAGGTHTRGPGTPTNQFVNFEQFGRCLDVTSGNFANDHLIAYPCKQAPDSSTLSWNQLWRFEPIAGKTGTFFTTPRTGANQNNPQPSSVVGQKMCLTATNTIYVRGVVCDPAQPLSQQWTAVGANAVSPQLPYTVINRLNGRCMSLSEPNDLSATKVRKITMEACDGSLNEQRWNAPPPPPLSGLNAIREGTSIRTLN